MVRWYGRILILVSLLLGFLWLDSSSVLAKDAACVYKYKVRSWDTLWSIAENFYGSGFDWHKISKLSNDRKTTQTIDSPLIYPGEMLSFVLEEYYSWARKNVFLGLYINNSSFSEWCDRKRGYIRLISWAPMVAYINTIGKGFQDVHAEEFDYFDDVDKANLSSWYGDYTWGNKDKNIIHVSYYTVSPEGNKYAVRVIEKNIGFRVVNNGELEDPWVYLDDIVFSPDGNSLSYRVKNDFGQWGIVQNGNILARYWDWVFVNAYNQGGILYSFVKDKESDANGSSKDVWLVLKNGDVSKRFDYTDSVMYSPKAINFIYRAKKVNSANDEDWFIVIGDMEQKHWNYIDNLGINLTDHSIRYRARDDEGYWYRETIVLDDFDNPISKFTEKINDK